MRGFFSEKKNRIPEIAVITSASLLKLFEIGSVLLKLDNNSSMPKWKISEQQKKEMVQKV